MSIDGFNNSSSRQGSSGSGLSPLASGAGKSARNTVEGGSMLASKLKENLIDETSSLTDINKAITDNTALISLTQKQINNLQETINGLTTAAMAVGGSDESSSFDPSNEITEYKQKLDDAQKTLDQLQETRNDLIKNYSKARNKMQQARKKIEEDKKSKDAQKSSDTPEKKNSHASETTDTIKSNGNQPKVEKTTADASHDEAVARGKSALQKDKILKDKTQKDIQAKELGKNGKKLNPSHQKSLDAKAGSRARFNQRAANKSASSKALNVKTASGAKSAANNPLAKDLMAKKMAASKGAAKGTTSLLSKAASAIGKGIKGITTAIGNALGPIIPYVLLFIGIIAAFILLLIIIFAILYFAKPLDRSYTLKTAVYLTEQHYHNDILGEINTRFYSEDDPIDESEIAYYNNQLNWKEILCYWYVLGCSRDGITDLEGNTFEFTYAVDADSVDIYDMVCNQELPTSEINMITEAYNALNTILIYPDDYTRRASKHFANSDELNAFIADLDSRGVEYTVYGGSTVVYMQRHKNAIVNVEQTALRDFAEELDNEEMRNHIDLCLRAVDEDNRSLEPTFYDIWEAICDLTSLDTGGCELLVREAYAMWIMSGARAEGSTPSDAINAYGVEEPLDVTIYRESSVGDIPYPFRFVYWNTEGNQCETVMSVLPWLVEEGTWQRSMSVPVFLNPDYTFGGNSVVVYSNNGIGRIGFIIEDINDDLDNLAGDATYYNNVDFFRDKDPNGDLIACAGMPWTAYCYHVIRPDYYGTDNRDNNAWCAAFVNSLANNMYPHGCFFTERQLFIDSNNPSWTVYYGNENETPWAEATEEMTDAITSFSSGSFRQLCQSILRLSMAASDKAAATWVDEYINGLQLTAETHYYRINLTNVHSDLSAGLYDGAENSAIFPPSAPDNADYRPDPEDFTDWLGVDLGSVVRFETRMQGADTAVQGHQEGWYSPRMTISTTLGEYSNARRAQLFCDIASSAGTLMSLAQSGVVIDVTGDAIVSLLQGLGLADEDAYRAVLPQYIDEFQTRYFSIFGELPEETQSLFYNESYCPYMYDDYSRAAENTPVRLYSAYGYGMSIDMYSACAGDVVLYDNNTFQVAVLDDAGRVEGYEWRSDGESDHVGLIVWASEDGSHFATIEGNTYVGLDDGNGYCIAMRYHSITDRGIMSIVHLPYGGTSDAMTEAEG